MLAPGFARSQIPESANVRATKAGRLCGRNPRLAPGWDIRTPRGPGNASEMRRARGGAEPTTDGRSWVVGAYIRVDGGGF